MTLMFGDRHTQVRRVESRWGRFNSNDAVQKCLLCQCMFDDKIRVMKNLAFTYLLNYFIINLYHHRCFQLCIQR